MRSTVAEDARLCEAKTVSLDLCKKIRGKNRISKMLSIFEASCKMELSHTIERMNKYAQQLFQQNHDLIVFIHFWGRTGVYRIRAETDSRFSMTVITILPVTLTKF